jgi:hypothetical protein
MSFSLCSTVQLLIRVQFDVSISDHKATLKVAEGMGWVKDKGESMSVLSMRGLTSI